MKKIILSFVLVCFIGLAKSFAQSTDAKASTPSVSAVAPGTAVNSTKTVSGVQMVETSNSVKESPKESSKKSCCSHSKKSCCSSKVGASKKDCSHKQSEKGEIKSENTDSNK